MVDDVTKTPAQGILAAAYVALAGVYVEGVGSFPPFIAERPIIMAAV